MNPRDLQNAFPPMPESCRDALMIAAGSAKEENKMKRTFRFTAVLAALMLVLTSVAYAVSRPQVLDWLINRDAAVPLWLEEAAQTVDAKASADGVNVSVDSLVYDGNWLMFSFDVLADDLTEALLIDMDNTISLNGEPARMFNLLTGGTYMLPKPGLINAGEQRNLFQLSSSIFDVPSFSGVIEAEITFRIYRPEKGIVLVDEEGHLTGDLPANYGEAYRAMHVESREAVAAMTNVTVIEGDPEPWKAEGYTPVDIHGWLIAERDENGRLLETPADLHLTETVLTLSFTFSGDACTVYDFSGVEVPRLRDAWVHVKTFRFSPLTCQADVYLIPYINDTHVNVEHDSYLMYKEYGNAVLTDENGQELSYSDPYWHSGGMHCFIDKEDDEWCVRYSFTLPGLETLPESIGLTTKEGDLVRFSLR